MEFNDSTTSAKDICKMLLKEGILSKETHNTVIRFAPLNETLPPVVAFVPYPLKLSCW